MYYNGLFLGTIGSMELNKQPINTATVGDIVCIRIDGNIPLKARYARLPPLMTLTT